MIEVNRIVLDLCGGSGAWSRPYMLAGYDVRLVTLPEQDVRNYRPPPGVHGVLMAPPCTYFSYARNRYKPTAIEYEAALDIVHACLRIMRECHPLWWALENPINKLRRFIGEPNFRFYQWQFGDAGHKPTGIWGRFRPPMFRYADQFTRSKLSTWRTNKENAKPEDAVTPPGFAQAFFEANP
jgi:hypothetical protein